MKRLIGSVAIGVTAIGITVAALASGATAGTGPRATTTTLPPSIIGTSPTHNMFFYVDTIQGGGGNPKPAVGCSQTNEFIVGQNVVFRMFGLTIPTGGGVLLPSDVKSATVTIPGIAQPIPFVYGSHGTVSFWSAAWLTTGYPNMGVVDFVVKVVTNPIPANSIHGAIPSLTGYFSQRGLSPTSRLTINPAAG
jgi:hypothetical protein